MKFVDCFPENDKVNMIAVKYNLEEIFIASNIFSKLVKVMSVPKKYKILVKSEIPNQKV